MSKGVSKQCSILNYIRRSDEDLHELLQDLCLGKMLVPRKGTPGLTFLRPDKALLKEIQAMAAGDEPEAAIEALQSLVLLDNISSVREFDDKKSDIPTYLRKKLPVVSVDGKKVVLKNGAEIVPDKDFEARKDRGNISVYVISKALVPSDGPDADFSNAKVKAKKGGADLDGARQALFERVLNDFCQSDRDPAMELLAAMYGWATSDEGKAHPGADRLAKAIAAKASCDTLATLAIILQPYKPGNPDYLDDATLGAFRDAMYGTDAAVPKDGSARGNVFRDLPVYSVNRDVRSLYEGLCEGTDGKVQEAAGRVQDMSARLSRQFAKLNAVRLLSDVYSGDFAQSVYGSCGCPVASKSTLFAEAELRALSAMVLENSNGSYDYNELHAVYANCKLDGPYMCNDKDLVQGSNLGFYYSTVYLIARSDALVHVPSTNGDTTESISQDNVFISLNKSMRNELQRKRDASHAMVNSFTARKW